MELRPSKLEKEFSIAPNGKIGCKHYLRNGWSQSKKERKCDLFWGNFLYLGYFWPLIRQGHFGVFNFKTHDQRVKRTEIGDSETLAKHVWYSFRYSCSLGTRSFGALASKMVCNLKTAGRWTKPAEFWDWWALIQQNTFGINELLFNIFNSHTSCTVIKQCRHMWTSASLCSQTPPTTICFVWHESYKHIYYSHWK